MSTINSEKTTTRKIAFFDIDGTLTSELTGTIPESAVYAIQQARKNGHLMFINTGRCFQNVEERFLSVGFDGLVCGCGTNIYCDKREIFYLEQPHDVIQSILKAARDTNVDICFESKKEVVFDQTRPLIDAKAIKQFYAFKQRHYDMSHSPDSPDFTCDKFVIWFQDSQSLTDFRKVSDAHFSCIDRGGSFREFVPLGFSKATGISQVLAYYDLPISSAYVFGDSNNDRSMLEFVPNSVVMGNAEDTSLFSIASFVTKKASEDGIAHALQALGFLD